MCSLFNTHLIPEQSCPDEDAFIFLLCVVSPSEGEWRHLELGLWLSEVAGLGLYANHCWKVLPEFDVYFLIVVFK